jgi:hypothetical protein
MGEFAVSADRCFEDKVNQRKKKNTFNFDHLDGSWYKKTDRVKMFAKTWPKMDSDNCLEKIPHTGYI